MVNAVWLLRLYRQFSDGPPLGKLAPSGGREPHAVGDHGGIQFSDGPPQASRRAAEPKLVPLGLSAAVPSLPAQAWAARRAVASGIGTYSAAHAVANVGAIPA